VLGARVGVSEGMIDCNNVRFLKGDLDGIVVGIWDGSDSGGIVAVGEIVGREAIGRYKIFLIVIGCMDYRLNAVSVIIGCIYSEGHLFSVIITI